MAVVSLPNYKLTRNWVKISDMQEYQVMNDTPVKIQVVGDTSRARIVMGTSDEPADLKQGCELVERLSLEESADGWWVRGNGSIAIWVED